MQPAATIKKSARPTKARKSRAPRGLRSTKRRTDVLFCCTPHPRAFTASASQRETADSKRARLVRPVRLGIDRVRTADVAIPAGAERDARDCLARLDERRVGRGDLAVARDG